MGSSLAESEALFNSSNDPTTPNCTGLEPQAALQFLLFGKTKPTDSSLEDLVFDESTWLGCESCLQNHPHWLGSQGSLMG